MAGPTRAEVFVLSDARAKWRKLRNSLFGSALRPHYGTEQGVAAVLVRSVANSLNLRRSYDINAIRSVPRA
jgi:hypothetical protein